MIDCELYQQADRLILHLLNLTSAATWRAPIHELIPIGPLQIKLRISDPGHSRTVRTLVSRPDQPLAAQDRRRVDCFELQSVLDHEVVVIENGT